MAFFTTIAGSVTLAAIANAAVSVAVSTLASTALGALLGPGASRQRPGDPGPLVSVLQAGGPKRVVFGRVGVRAARLIANERIDRVHHWVAAVSDWPIDSFLRVLVRGQAVELDAEGWVTSEPWGAAGAQTIRFRFWTGEDNDLSELIALDLVPAGSRGVDTAIVWAEIHVPQTDEWIRLFQGAVPDFVFEVQGARVYDPTDPTQRPGDRSTWTFAREAILVQAFHQICPLGRGRSWREIDWPQVGEILARHRPNVTSRLGDVGPRFAADGVWTCQDERHWDVEERIGLAHAGGLVDMPVSPAGAGAGGALQRFVSSDVSGDPVATLGAEDIGPGGIGREDVVKLDERPNGVRVTFPNRNRNYERDTLTIVLDEWVAEDGGETRLLSIDLGAVTAHKQAATVGLIQLRRQRLAQRVTGEWALRLIGLQAGDWAALDLEELDLAGTERFAVLSSGISAADFPELVLVQDEAAWHVDAGDLEPAEVPLPEAVEHDSALGAPVVTVSSGATALIALDRVTSAPGVRVTVGGEAGAIRRAFVTLRYGLAPNEVVKNATIEMEGEASGSIVIGPLPAGVEVAWTVRVVSDRDESAETTGTHVVSGDPTAPGAPSNLAASSPAAGRIEVSADAPGAADVIELVFAYVATGDPAPDMAAVVTRKVRGARPGEDEISARWLSVPDDDWDVYAAAVDVAGNISALVGPETVTVS